ncbi:hypothetical protein J437_LFUL010581 [Ladona fulva]|uniref:Nudix hydrolase domain-containing protein n=1 Tax=Ladona fulva TaxID=123851 RepID=A0A8K0KAJ7_LADFU|nr:hypothetical protein J437_LFUL010581 [Ladona fulva]
MITLFSMSKYWKDAASVLVLVRSLLHNSLSKGNNARTAVKCPADYKILVVKRAAKSSFMPNGYVFPGGLCHEADASKEWLELYNTINVGPSRTTYPFSPEKDVNKIRSNNCLSFNGNGDLPKPLSLRITAIRELFEESGILLVRSKRIDEKTDYFSSTRASYLYSDEIIEWQSRIQQDPKEFINFCHHFNCVPDVWSLKDWSFWLTPLHVSSKRFDTAFFITALSHIPPTRPDEKEVSDLKWSTPTELLENHSLQKLWLPPPQFYELSRIRDNFTKIQKAMEHSSSWVGCDRWMPVEIKANDGRVYLLPGDEVYPKVPDYEGSKVNNDTNETAGAQSMKELRANSSRLHRFEIRGAHDQDIVISHFPSTDHVYPKKK